LWAFALESLQDDDRAELLRRNRTGIARIRALYDKADVFDKARRLATKYVARAREAVQTIPHESLQKLLTHLLDTLT